MTVPPIAGRPLALDAATETLYAAFAAAPHRPDMPRCHHCVTADDVAALGAPVRTLDPTLVARFLTKSGTTWGDATDLRRVAPRALHLAAEHRLPLHRTVVLAKLSADGWAGWPAPQVDAVCRFLLAEWARLLASPPRAGHAAHRWLRQTATAVSDVSPFLETWHDVMADGPGPAAAHLAVLLVNSELRPDFPGSVADLFDPPGDPASGGPGAPGAPGAPERLATWLTATGTELHLRRAAVELAHTTDARRLALAVERLRRFHATRERTG